MLLGFEALELLCGSEQVVGSPHYRTEVQLGHSLEAVQLGGSYLLLVCETVHVLEDVGAQDRERA